MSSQPPPPGSRSDLLEVALLFFRLGSTGFGGPAAHIAMMEDEVVRRRGWVTRQHFLDLLGATNLIPGPSSTEMAIHLGYHRAGWTGLAVAGLCFIVPASAITMALAWAYVRYGALPQTAGLLYGIKPVIIAIVVQALFGLGRAAIKSPALAMLAAAVALANWLGISEIGALLSAGVAAVTSMAMRQRLALAMVTLLSASPPAGAAIATSPTVPFSLAALFWFFLKVGTVLYGSGYVLLAFLQGDLVVERGWMTEAQLLDAVAVGQVTPGPVFTTATFIGYFLGGVPGGVLATLGIFLPSFLLVAASGPLVPRIRRSAAARAFLDGVNAGALALMAVVTFTLARAAIVDLTTLVVALASAVLLLRYRVSSLWLTVAGAALGLASGWAT
ncbi:MAG TPA: chromate efflux transporter [Terriglobales bacterium]|nr:chromate efflux transporter [Terriglobales bacterium]